MTATANVNVMIREQWGEPFADECHWWTIEIVDDIGQRYIVDFNPKNTHKIAIRVRRPSRSSVRGTLWQDPLIERGSVEWWADVTSKAIAYGMAVMRDNND